MKIRDYREDDHAACMRVFDSNIDPFFQPSERPEFQAFLNHLPGPYFVVEDEAGEVVACGGFAVDAGCASFCWGMVLRALHGRGVGRMLSQERLRRIMVDPTVTRIRLDTSQHTTAFYTKLGFRITEIEPDGYGPGLDKCYMILGDADAP